MRCASNTGCIKCNQILRILNGKNSHRRADAFLQSHALQVLAPPLTRNQEEVANRAVARVLPIQLLKMLVFLDTLPGDASVYFLGILYSYPGDAAPS